MQNILNQLINYAIAFGTRFIAGAVVLIIGLKLSKFFVRALKKGKAYSHLDSSIQTLISSTVKVILNTLVIILVVEILGVPSATIVAVLGSCGLAIGLALQGGLSNLAGGVMILIFKPFKEGDYVSSPNGDGTVEEIGIFYTKLITPDNIGISIPNGILSNSAVSNYNAKDTRRIDIDFSISYGSDIDLAKKVLLATAESYEKVLKDPAPTAMITSQLDSAIQIRLRVWVNSADYWSTKFDLTEDVKKTFDSCNITIPYPQMDVHIKNS